MHNYKAVIVTGASSGIGAEIANIFCTNGSLVFAVARNTKKLEIVRNNIPKKYRSKFVIKKCDVSKAKDVEKCIKSIFNQTNVDLVVSNAGIGYSKPFMSYTAKEIDDVLTTNIQGAINITQSCLANRKKQRTQIVYTSSLAGRIGFPNMSIYSASKFALEGFVESLRGEYPRDDVTFTLLRPGITRTPFFKKAGMEKFEESVKDLKSCYTPEEVAAEFYNKISPDTEVIVVGNDKYFLKILPFTPKKYRFHVLDFINKL